MTNFRITIVSAIVICGCFARFDAVAQPGGQQSALLAVEWNEAVLGVAEAEDGFLTLKGLRTTTIMHLAMHDALNSIERRYEPYVLNESVQMADPVAAAAEAAHIVASNQYPDQTSVFDSVRDPWIQERQAASSTNRGVELGIELGRRAAHAILETREADGWDNEAVYAVHPMGPGVYAEFPDHSGTPEGFVFGAGWATAKPFALTSVHQFVADPPPAIDSDEYTEAFNEVKELGRFQSSARTIDQTHIALWWKDFVENSHNRLARQLMMRENLDLIEATRMFALLNMSVFDAYVNSFHNKFLYNHWRPYTAIRWAANDGNPSTEAEETWTNTHRHTYPFPSYPSAHGEVCAAAMTTFADTFGDDYGFTMSTPMVDVAGPFSGKIETRPATRSFESFYDAAEECAMSRVYLGIHFRYDSVFGNALGKMVGDYVVAHELRRVD